MIQNDFRNDTKTTKITFQLKNRVRQPELDADTNIIIYRQVLKSVRSFVPDNDTVKIYLTKLDSIYRAGSNNDVCE